jgi:hypothetical protein
MNKNSRQDNINNSSSSNNYNKKTLEDFQNCGIISRQEPKEIQSPVRSSFCGPKYSIISTLDLAYFLNCGTISRQKPAYTS